MDQKMQKMITIILGVFFLLSMFFAFSYVAKYNSLENEYTKLQKNAEDLAKERDTLYQKATAAEKEIARMRERQDIIKSQLDKASSERDDLARKLEDMIRQRDELTEKLNQALSTASQAQAAPEAHPAGGDEYWAGILKEKANLEVQLADLRDMLKVAQIKADEQAALELDIQKLTKEKEDLQMRLEYNEKSMDNLSMQLLKERNNKRDLQKQLSLLRQDNSELRVHLKEAVNNKLALEKKLKDTDDKRMELYNRLVQMDQLLEDKLSSLYETKEVSAQTKKSIAVSGAGSNIELSPIIVRSQQEDAQGVSSTVVSAPPSPMGLAIEGKIINVNSENNFVVLDKGENQGVHRGMIFGVYRGQNQIATVEVIGVRANVSAADIRAKSASIKVGDIIK